MTRNRADAGHVGASPAYRRGATMTRDELILQYERLAWKEAGAARLWAFPLGTLDDIAQVAFIALVKAADTFDPTVGAKFITYATTCIRNGLRRAVEEAGFIRVPSSTQRAIRRAPNPACRLQRAAAKTEVSFETGETDLTHEPDRLERLGDWIDVEQAIGTLLPRLQKIIRMRFLEGLTLEQTGDRLRISKERARQLIVAALAKLRERLGVEGTPRQRRKKGKPKNPCGFETLGLTAPTQKR